MTSPAVLLIVDGLRPDALTSVFLSNFAALRARGATTLRASSVMPTITLPCHVSLFHSVPPTRHGITTNVWMPMVGAVRPSWEMYLKSGDKDYLQVLYEELFKPLYWDNNGPQQSFGTELNAIRDLRKMAKALGHDADVALPRILDDFAHFLLRVKTAVPRSVLSRAPRAHLLQLGILIYGQTPALIFGQMPVKDVVLVQGHPVEVALYKINGEKMAAHVQVHAAPGKARCVLYLRAGQLSRAVAVDGQQLADRLRTVEKSGGRSRSQAQSVFIDGQLVPLVG